MGVIFFTLSFLLGHAIELPSELVARVPSAQSRLDSISFHDAHSLTQLFSSQLEYEFVGAGCEGFVLSDGKGKAWKFSLRFVLNPDGLSSEWQPMADFLRSLPFYDDIKQLLHSRQSEGWPLKQEPLFRELFGGIVWSAYNEPHDVVFPEQMSEDGFVYQTRFVDGPSLNQVLDLDKAGKSPYESRALWADLVRLQRINERILQETGVAVDLFNPSNFLVTGPVASPRLVAVDYSLAYPQSGIRERLQSSGVVIPHYYLLALQVGAFPFPLISTQIVSSRLFGLNFPQASSYVAAYFGGYEPDSTRTLQLLAGLTKWPNFKYPAVMDHSNIEHAQCALLFSHEN